MDGVEGGANGVQQKSRDIRTRTWKSCWMPAESSGSLWFSLLGELLVTDD